MTLIYFMLVLGITVFIHELGHFIFAKKAGVYVYEFSIGMGPKIFGFKRKNDETTYSIRLFPIGGFVQMAGEEISRDENVPLEKHMYKKTWLQRLSIIVAGVLFNFLLAIVILFIIGLVNGASDNKAYIASISNEYDAINTELAKGDQILYLNDKKINSIDKLNLELQLNYGKELDLTVKSENGDIKDITIKPTLEEIDGEEAYRYGFSISSKTNKGIIASIKYAFSKFFSLIEQMALIIGYLFTGKLKLNSLSGPVGIFTVVGQSAKAGLINLVYLVAYLCINVGFINIMPFPAFDGGRLLFLIIEKLKGSPVSSKVENTIHSVGFVLLMILMIAITYNDIMRLFS